MSLPDRDLDQTAIELTAGTMDLAAEIDHLGHVIDRFVADQRHLLAAHLALVAAARLACRAWATQCLDADIVSALQEAIALTDTVTREVAP